MKVLLSCLTALALLAVTPAARADVVWGPTPTEILQSNAPWLLVAAVVVITALILWRLRSKKK